MQKSTVSSNTFNSKCLHSPFQVVPKAESPHQHCLIQGHEDTHRCSSTTQCWVDYPASGTCFPCKHLFLRCMHVQAMHSQSRLEYASMSCKRHPSERIISWHPNELSLLAVCCRWARSTRRSWTARVDSGGSSPSMRRNFEATYSI